MDVKYVNPTPSELYHHGVLGQKWGIRRYQNKDGSLTAAGKAKLKQFKKDETASIRKKLSEKKIKINEKISNAESAEKKKELRSKLQKAKINAKAEIDVVKNYTLKDIQKEKIAVGAEVTAKTLLAVGTFVIPFVPDVAGVALIASSHGAKQRYRLKGE